MKSGVRLIVAGCSLLLTPLTQPHAGIVIKLDPGCEAKAFAAAYQAKAPTTLPALEQVLRAWTAEKVVAQFEQAGKPHRNPLLFTELGLNRYLLVDWKQRPMTSEQVQTVVNQLKQVAAVETVEMDAPGSGAYMPNDPQLSTQWHHATINSTSAWAYTKGNPNTLVAVIDSGLSTTNSDFNYANVTTGYDYVDADWDTEDMHGHGTHCAGIVANTGDNNIMGAGLSWDSSLLIIRVLDASNSCTMANVAAAIVEAADTGADVLSISIQSTSLGGGQQAALDYATGLGCISVACMGNWGSSMVSYPAGFTNTIAVGNSQSNDIRASSSNYGVHIDVVSPGTDILSTIGDTNASWSGTSMATPMVAAMASCLKEMRPDWNIDQVRESIHTFAEDEVGDPAEDVPGFDQYMGYGRINFGAAVMFTSASTNCPLSFAAAMMMPVMMTTTEPFYWLRNVKFKMTPRGKELVQDYYLTAPAVVAVIQKDPWLTKDLVKLSLDLLPYIANLRNHPTALQQIPASLAQRTWQLVRSVSERLSPAQRQVLNKWLQMTQTDPVGILQQLGINAQIVPQQ